MDLGDTLRRAREQRGLTLDELSLRTKISPRFLHALEHNDFTALPGGLFTRGFLRAYAREVGLDPVAIVGEYVVQAAPPPAEPAPERRSAGPLADDRSRLLANAAFGLAALAVGFYLWLGVSRTPPDAPVGTPAESVTGTGGSEAAEPAATSAASADLPSPVAMSSTGLEIVVHPTGDCWVEAVADGEVQLYRLMHGGDRATIRARRQVELRIGEPSTFAFTINGNAGRAVGRPGQPATVRISAGNAATFVG
jgi:cytoskeletal protein RodZ